MITKNDISLKMMIGLLVLEDLQLLFFPWRHELFNPLTDYKVIQYVFSPIYFLARQATLPTYIIAHILILLLAILVIVCAKGLVKGRLKILWPLQALRGFTALFTTILLTPLLEIMIQPLFCNGDDVYGFSMIECSSSVRIALYAASAISTIFLLGYSSFMSALYFPRTPRSKIGKSTGFVDLLYVWARLAMVLITTLVESTRVSSIVVTVIIGFLTLLVLVYQPFYEQALNKIRFSLFFSAFIVSVCSIGAAFNDFGTKDGPSHVPYVIACLGLGFAAIPVGFVFCGKHIRSNSKTIFKKLQEELQYRKEAKNNDLTVHKSQLELIYDDVETVIETVARDHVVAVYPSAHWVEITSRFIRTAYLDSKAVTLALDLFEVAFEQFPRSAHVSFVFWNIILLTGSCIYSTWNTVGLIFLPQLFKSPSTSAF